MKTYRRFGAQRVSKCLNIRGRNFTNKIYRKKQRNLLDTGHVSVLVLQCPDSWGSVKYRCSTYMYMSHRIGMVPFLCLPEINSLLLLPLLSISSGFPLFSCLSVCLSVCEYLDGLVISGADILYLQANTFMECCHSYCVWTIIWLYVVCPYVWTYVWT